MSIRCFRVLGLWAVLALGARGQGLLLTSKPIPTQIPAAGTTALMVDLRNYFTVSGVTGQVAQFDTVLGKFDAELLASDAPKTVQNFLNYVNSGRYNNTFFHRSVPGFVIQAGGWVLSGNNVPAITTDAPVQNEFKVSNTRGTLAMAKLGSGPDTATSQWFVNLADNSANLDNQNGGFTVFARILGSGMRVADAIAAVQTYNASDFNSAFSNIPLLTGGLTPDDLVLVRSIKIVPLFPTTSTDEAFASFSATSSDTSVATVTVNGSILNLTVLANGRATITVRSTDINNTSTSTTFVVTNGAPVITTQPLSQTIAAGGNATFTAAAGGTGPFTYQWKKNGSAIAGATGTTYSVTNLAASAAGDYTVSVTNANGTETGRVARLVVGTPVSGRLANLSVRTPINDATQTLIVGVTMAGGTRDVLVRAAGPALAVFGLTNAMADPRLDLYSGATVVKSNDNWDPLLKPAFDSVGAFPFGAGSKDAALTSPLLGGYTIQTHGTAGGVVLVEAYDLGTANSPRFANLSARNLVGTGDNILIAGFNISGNAPKKLLIRGVGPSLAGFGVAGALADPKLAIYDTSATPILMARGDNWSDEPDAADIATTSGAVGAFALTSGSKDAALLVTLPAGGYTAQVSGVNGVTGEALVEIYEVQ